MNPSKLEIRRWLGFKLILLDSHVITFEWRHRPPPDNARRTRRDGLTAQASDDESGANQNDKATDEPMNRIHKFIHILYSNLDDKLTQGYNSSVIDYIQWVLFSRLTK